MHHGKAADCRQPAGINVVTMAQDMAILSEYKYVKLISVPKRGRLTLRKNAGPLMMLFTLVTWGLLALPDYVQKSPDMTTSSQICFCGWLVVPAEEVVLCSALAGGGQSRSAPPPPARSCWAPRHSASSKAVHRAPAAQLSGFHAFHSENGRTRCIKPAPREQCALPIAPNRQVFSLEVFMLSPATT